MGADEGTRSQTAADSGARIWTQVIESLRGDGRMEEIVLWAAQTSPVRHAEGRLVVAAPSAFVRDRILHQHVDILLEIARRADPELATIEVIVDLDAAPPAIAVQRRATSDPAPWPTGFFESPSSRPRMRFERLVRGMGNAAAARAGIHLAEALDPQFLSVFVHGEIGTGKTHIRHAIVQRFRESHPGRIVLSTTAEEYTAEYGRACKDSLGQAFRDRCARVDLLAIDDLQTLEGRPGTQRQLLAVLDLLLESGRRVAAFGNRPLRFMAGIDPRIITRLSGGPNAALETPDAETRFAILKDLANNIGGGSSGMRWHDDALRYIAEGASPDCRDLEGCILQVLSAMEPLQLEITRARAVDALQHRFLVLHRRFTVVEVRKQVAKYFGTEERSLVSKSRASNVVLARQVAMYIARKLTGYSLSAIGAEFGGRDHSTVSYAIRRVDQACKNELVFDAEIQELIRSLEAS